LENNPLTSCAASLPERVRSACESAR
jgi:hypothetical protein